MTLPNWCKRAEDGFIEIDTGAAMALYLGKDKLDLPLSALNLDIARRCIQADLIDFCVVNGEDYGLQKFLKPDDASYTLAAHPWDEKENGPVDQVAGKLWRAAFAKMPKMSSFAEVLAAYCKRYEETGDISAPKESMARGAFEQWLKDLGAYQKHSDERQAETDAIMAAKQDAQEAPAGG